MTRKFTPGDKIVVTGNGYALNRLLGSTGTFKSYFDQHSEYVYYMADDGETDSALESDLTLVEPEVKTVEVPGPSVKAQIEAIEAALATLKSTIGL